MRAPLLAVALLSCTSTDDYFRGEAATCVMRETRACQAAGHRLPAYAHPTAHLDGSWWSAWCYCRAHEVCDVPRMAHDPRVERDWDEDSPMMQCAQLIPRGGQ